MSIEVNHKNALALNEAIKLIEAKIAESEEEKQHMNNAISNLNSKITHLEQRINNILISTRGAGPTA